MRRKRSNDLYDRVVRVLAFVAFGRQREVDHRSDRILLHDPNQKNDPDDRAMILSSV